MSEPQWSPVMKTGNTAAGACPPPAAPAASMEPGHEDREYARRAGTIIAIHAMPQWSPVMKTGNTRARPAHGSRPARLNGARS